MRLQGRLELRGCLCDKMVDEWQQGSRAGPTGQPRYFVQHEISMDPCRPCAWLLDHCPHATKEAPILARLCRDPDATVS
ncbi:hypothetical protein NDU88_011418 [Pleurodeles waltl]|uniref:Uncharacterized protein n=1 Tax=Pleurodeles waltl TaxID=8319 RepID=A0AAV7QXJ5_PLEWA|nr:hypothetical protein NDU88_011418 [Pleurodeles waltl]